MLATSSQQLSSQFDAPLKGAGTSSSSKASLANLGRNRIRAKEKQQQAPNP